MWTERDALAWLTLADGVSRSNGWPTHATPAKLAKGVTNLSASYNHVGVSGDADLPARLGFFLVRDIPKSLYAVRELVACRLLSIPVARPLEVLDIGAGLGATTFGIVHALERAGARGGIHATMVDSDAKALELAMQLARRIQGDVSLTASAHRSVPTTGKFDLIVCGQVLSELDLEMDPVARVQKHVDWLEGLSQKHLRDDGSLVCIEPALRDRTRHLHRVRDGLLEKSHLQMFAPCTHNDRCPALVIDTDWCHEDIDVDLPAPLKEVAREAGLRHQGLTFSYAVFRKDGKNALELASCHASGYRARVVSNLVRTKGKTEFYLCGDLRNDQRRGRVMRLDRHQSASNKDWDGLARGNYVSLDPLGPTGRVESETCVKKLTP